MLRLKAYLYFYDDIIINLSGLRYALCCLIIFYCYVIYLQVGGVVDRPSTPPSWAGSQMSLNSQQTGIRNLQKSIDETSKIKQEVGSCYKVIFIHVLFFLLFIQTGGQLIRVMTPSMYFIMKLCKRILYCVFILVLFKSIYCIF